MTPLFGLNGFLIYMQLCSFLFSQSPSLSVFSRRPGFHSIFCLSSSVPSLQCHNVSFPFVGLFPVRLIAPVSPNIPCIESLSDACDLISFGTLNVQGLSFMDQAFIH